MGLATENRLTIEVLLTPVVLVLGTALVAATAKAIADWMLKAFGRQVVRLRPHFDRCRRWRPSRPLIAGCAARVLARILTGLRHLDPEGREIDPGVIDLLRSKDLSGEGLGVVLLTFANAVMGLLDRAARADMTVVVGVELGLAGGSMLAIGAQGFFVDRLFGAVAVVMGGLLLAISRCLADHRRPRYLSVSLCW